MQINHPKCDKLNNVIAEEIVKQTKDLNASFLDSENILWKIIEGKWVGKRSVFTYDFRACWLQDVNTDNIKSYWCGESADYNEIFIYT